MLDEFLLFRLAAAFYLAATVAALFDARRRSVTYTVPLWLLGGALVLNSASLLIRWDRLDHGPYVDLYETLSSSVWGYHFALWLGALMISRVRPILAPVLPILAVIVVWTLVVPPRDAQMPVTYDTIWLPTHIILGKIFIGCVIVAMGLGLVALSRRVAESQNRSRTSALRFPGMPDSVALEELAFRFMLVAFVFDTIMLIVGALWAQDAWGRYWAWDPLEVWSFLTWVAAAFYLHLRVIRRPSPAVGAGLISLVFVLAVLTYFGIPFLSSAAHQGVV